MRKLLTILTLQWFCLSFVVPAFAAREKRANPPTKQVKEAYELEVTIGSDPKLPKKSSEAIEAMQFSLIRELSNWPWISEAKLDPISLVFAHANGPLINQMFDETPAATTMSVTLNDTRTILIFWDRVLGRADSPLVYTLGAVAGELYAQFHLTTPTNSPPHLAEVVALQGKIDFYRWLFRSPDLIYYGIKDLGEIDYQLQRSIRRYEALRGQPEFSHQSCRELLTTKAN